MIILSSLYAKYHAVPGIVLIFSGLQVVVVALVANATYSFGKSTFKNYKDVLLAITSEPYFLIATKGILVSFVGLLFFVTVKFGLAVPWDIVKALLACAALAALLKRVDILYVVIITAVISVFIF